MTYAVKTGLCVSLFGPSFQPLNCDTDANKSWAIFTENCRSNKMVNNIVGAGECPHKKGQNTKDFFSSKSHVSDIFLGTICDVENTNNITVLYDRASFLS